MDFSGAGSTWQALGTIEPSALTKTRVAMHWAAQIASSVGTTHANPDSDFSHTNLEWLNGALLGQPVGSSGARGGLRLADARLVLTDRAGKTRAEKALEGLMLYDGMEWLGRALHGVDSSLTDALIRPEHELPDHAVANEGAFTLIKPSQCKELALWFSNADAIFREIAIELPTASSVRCWPHHFDLATLIALDDDQEAENARTVGVGFSPGDGSYDEPYFYVTPWPRPEQDLPDLAVGGVWHTEGWTGAALTASVLTQDKEADAQFRRASTFVASAVNAAFGLLGEPPP